MAILAAFALLHAEHHSLGINVADLQRDDLHGSQTSAVGNAERRLVLGPRRGLQETQHLFGREHAWQFAWLVDEHEMSRRLRPVECHLEEESERESREPLDGTDVLALRIGHEPAHAHVFEPALAQRADGLLAHWGLLS